MGTECSRSGRIRLDPRVARRRDRSQPTFQRKRAAYYRMHAFPFAGYGHVATQHAAAGGLTAIIARRCAGRDDLRACTFPSRSSEGAASLNWAVFEPVCRATKTRTAFHGPTSTTFPRSPLIAASPSNIYSLAALASGHQNGLPGPDFSPKLLRMETTS